jgi:hypothetical protein
MLSIGNGMDLDELGDGHCVSAAQSFAAHGAREEVFKAGD